MWILEITEHAIVILNLKASEKRNYALRRYMAAILWVQFTGVV